MVGVENPLGGMLKSRWWDANFRRGDANSLRGTRPPYNLNTAVAPPSPIGLPTKMLNKKNTTFLALLRLSFAVE